MVVRTLLVVLILTSSSFLCSPAYAILLADAGLPRYAAIDPVQLDGSGSYDADGVGVLTYEWRQLDGPPLDISDANTPTPTISGFVQTDAVQTCTFELTVGCAGEESEPDTTSVIIVPDFGESTLQLENESFDPNKPTFMYFAGGDCTIGYGDVLQLETYLVRANIIDFPDGYEPNSTQPLRNYDHYGDMIIVYLSAVAPDYCQQIQTSGWSTGGQPALDVGLRMNLAYQDARYTVNQVTFFDAQYCLQDPEKVQRFIDSSVDGEPCRMDCYKDYFPDVLNLRCDLSHLGVIFWYDSSLTEPDMNLFNHGVVAGAYWSVFGPGKNLSLNNQATTYDFRWSGNTTNGKMTLNNESVRPARLPEPITLLPWRDPWFADDDPNGLVLTCAESENVIGYQLLSGSDPHAVADYNVVTEGNSPPIVTAAMLPSSDAWWTIKGRNAYGATIYADPLHVDFRAAPSTKLAELVNFKRDLRVDQKDFAKLAQYWHRHEPSMDVVPTSEGEPIVDVHELTLLSECWLHEVDDPSLLAYWQLDETEGNVAHSCVGENHGQLHGDPIWRPEEGVYAGALQLDGTDDYVQIPFLLNPYDGPFSAFAWVKTDTAGNAVISQTGTHGASWLAIDGAGRLMTELQGSGRGAAPLAPGTAITDNQWHRVGFTWDGAYRTLYVDDVEVARDTNAQSITDANGGLHIGADGTPSASSFFSGLIDDVQIYDRAIKP